MEIEPEWFNSCQAYRLITKVDYANHSEHGTCTGIFINFSDLLWKMRIKMFSKGVLGILFIMLLVGCTEYHKSEKYKRPDWLPGKLYTTVANQGNLTMFAECLQLVGLDSVLDVSGAFAVFAPSDEAMSQYLSENQYASISDIPVDKLERITEFHIIQNPWTYDQLQSLGSDGWRVENSSDISSYAYKRQTIFKDPVDKYWYIRTNKGDRITVDSTVSDGIRKVVVPSRKYVPIFYDEYFDVNGLTSEDYSYYFDREYERGNVYYAGAKILQPDIFAENGFVHIIDRVVSPMHNAKQLLEKEMPDEVYKLFLEMVYWYYPSFELNVEATNNQPEVKQGGVAPDTLYNLYFPRLEFDLHNELTGYVGDLNLGFSNFTVVNHNGICAPADDAFREFVDGILTRKSGLPHWKDFRSLPWDIVEIIIHPHFTTAPIYPSTGLYRNIFGGNDGFQQNEGDIIRKEFGSNCTFIGLSTYNPDRVFTSVTGPVFLRPSYSTFRLAMLYSRTEDNVAYPRDEFCFFPLSNLALEADSSLILEWIDEDENSYSFRELNRSMQEIQNLSRNDIRDRILDHVGYSIPNGSANKEFIRTMNGNYIIWNNSDNSVQGTKPSTIGYDGEDIRICHPVPLSEPADNGKTWAVDYWFNFENINMHPVLRRYGKFYSLLEKAGLFNGADRIRTNWNYTIFVPSDEALTSYQVDTMGDENLAEFLRYHFLRDNILGEDLIFTDNKIASGIYNTAGEGSLNIRTGPDMIEILDSIGNPYVSIPEKENFNNVMISWGGEVTSVVHVIDRVLIQQ